MLKRSAENMNLTDLESLIEDARWFDCIGSAVASKGRIVLRSIDDWETGPSWDWLPTSSDQSSPFHSEEFQGSATPEEKEAYRKALKSMRSLPISVTELRTGPHDFTTAARKSAIYAARMAARELILGYPDRWLEIMKLYHEGFWACGYTAAEELVVL